MTSSTDYLIDPNQLNTFKEFLSNCFNQKNFTNEIQYKSIIKLFREKHDLDTYYKIIIVLKSFTSLMTTYPQNFKELLDLIFSYNFLDDKKISIAMIDLILCIVSSNVIYISTAFNCFAKAFLIDSSLGGDMSDIFEIIHSKIFIISQNIPTSLNNLSKSFLSFFPHYNRYNQNVMTQYIRQLFRISSYIPSLKYKILEKIIEKCLEIDVEIVIEDSGDVRLMLENEKEILNNMSDGITESADLNCNEDDYNEDIFQFDDENEKKAQAISSVNIVYSSEEKAKLPTVVSDLADKLDSMLALIVSYLEEEIAKGEIDHASLPSSNLSPSNVMKSTQSTPNLFFDYKESSNLKTSMSLSSLSSLNTSNCSISTSLSSTSELNSISSSSSSILNSFSNLPRIYIHLLNIFESKLLPTYKSKYVQFFLFFVSIKNNLFGELLILRLLEIGSDESASSVIRSSAFMYLASFLSRASFLKLEIIGKVVTRLATWSSLYIIKNYAYHAELFAPKDYSLGSSADSKDRLTKESFGEESSTPTSIISTLKTFLKILNSKKNEEIFNNSLHDNFNNSSYKDILMKGLDPNVYNPSNFTSTQESSPLLYDIPPSTARNSPCFTDIYDVNKLKNELETIVRNNFEQSPSSYPTPSSATPYLDSNFTFYEDEVPINIDLFYKNCFSYNDYGSLKFNVPQGTQHEVFYTAVQSMCYILCFHGLPLISLLFNNDSITSKNPEFIYSSEFLPSYINQLLFDLIFTSRFCPTRIISKNTVLEFVKLSAHVKLFSEYSWYWLREELLQYGILQEICNNIANNPNNHPTHNNNTQASSSYMGGSYMGGSYMGGSYMGNSYIGSYMSSYGGNNLDSITSSNNNSHNSAYYLLMEQQYFYSLCIFEYGLFNGTNNAPLILDICNNPANNTSPTFFYTSRFLTVVPVTLNALETFYPFDPCLLLRLHLLVDSGYRKWCGIPCLNSLQAEQVKNYIEIQERKKVDNYIDKYTSNNTSILSSSRLSTNSEEFDESTDLYDEYEEYYDSHSMRRFNL